MKHTLTRHLIIPLLAFGCMLNSCHTPVYYAAERGDLNAVKYHIERGDDLSGNDPTGISHLVLLPFALAGASVDFCLGILSFGAYWENFDNTIYGVIYNGCLRTAAEVAMDNGHINVVAHLLAHNAEAPAEVMEHMKQNHNFCVQNGSFSWTTQAVEVAGVVPVYEPDPAPVSTPAPRKSKPKPKPAPAPKPAATPASSTHTELLTGQDLSTPGR